MNINTVLLSVALLLTANYSQAFVAEAIPNYREINARVFRGGRPTVEGLQTLKQQGIKSIINLENVSGPVGREREQAKLLGFGFMSSPMSWIVPPKDEQIDKILRVMSNPENQPVYIHCLHGRDRTGLVSGLFRVLVEGMEPRDAYREMKDLGFRSFFVTLEYYFRQRTNFWNIRYHTLPGQENMDQDMDGELHDDSDMPQPDPTDLQS